MPTDVSAATLPIETGHVLAGRFEILGLAGRGGSARVFRARDQVSGSVVALKVMSGSDPHDVARFVRQAGLLVDVEHPSIVRYIAHGWLTPEEPFLAMEWLEGPDLGALLETRALTVAEALTVARHVAVALGHVHELGIVHRDVKPANLVAVANDLDQLKVIDFGIARAGPRRHEITSTGQVIGTPGYMAPEQVRGDDALDARVDVFALGCVLYRCLTGRPAFEGDRLEIVLGRILFGAPPALSRSVMAPLPPGLEVLVERMLAKDPDRRPANGAAVAQMLDEVVAGRGTLEPPRLPNARHISVLVLTDAPARTAHPEPLATVVDARTPRFLPARELLELLARSGADVDFTRDGAVLARFSSPNGGTDHIVTAVRCAARANAAFPSARIAVATGDAFLADGGARGEVIARAVTLSREARPGRPRLDTATAAFAERRFVVRREDETLTLGEPLGELPVRLFRGRPLPHVGRTREIDALVGLVRESFTERIARTAVVVGPAGIGKSRLLGELVSAVRHEHPGTEVQVVAGDVMGAHSPLGLLARLVRQVSGTDDDRAGEPAWRTQVAPALRAALGLEKPVGDAVESATRSSAADVEEAVTAWLRAACEAHPTLIAIDDQHWVDRASLRVLGRAIDACRELPLAVVALARPDTGADRPGMLEAALEIRLAPLRRQAGRALVRAALGDDLPEQLVDSIVDHGEGSPLLIEELARAHAGGRDDRGGVLALLSARIDGLPQDASDVLRVASVFGGTFAPDAVAALRGRPPEEVQKVIDDLVHREILALHRTGAASPSDATYAFHHALLRDAAYSKLVDVDRARLHALAARWLEAREHADPGTLAEHYDRAGERAHAARWFTITAERGHLGLDAEGTLSWVDRALACGPDRETEARLRIVEARAASWSGNSERMAVAVRTAASLEPVGSARWYQAQIGLLYSLGEELRLGDVAATCAAIVRAPPAEGTADERHLAILHAAQTLLLYLPDAPLAEQMFALLPDGRAPLAPQVRVLNAYVRAQRCETVGDFVAAERLAGDVRADAASADDARLAVMSLRALAHAKAARGAYPEAEAICVELAAQAAHLPWFLATIRTMLADMFARTGRRELAVDAARAGVESSGAIARHPLRLRALVGLAEALRRSGAFDEARRTAQQAIEQSDAMRATRAHALAVLARIELDAGRHGDAFAPAETAYALLSAGPMPDGDAFTRLVYADALRAGGRDEEAVDVLAYARARVLAKARDLLVPEQRAAFLSAVEENAVILARTLR